MDMLEEEMPQFQVRSTTICTIGLSPVPISPAVPPLQQSRYHSIVKVRQTLSIQAHHSFSISRKFAPRWELRITAFGVAQPEQKPPEAPILLCLAQEL
ncbi:MAG: hypothetical protein ACI9R3_001630 [Verrucomicrobiales bacterium]|jgi:hypothetical protein